MRGLAIPAALALLIAGCSAPLSTEEFKALALKAPDLLKTDLGPMGTLNRIEGDLTMHMTMTMEGETITTDTVVDLVQEIFVGGSYLMTMDMTTSMPNMTMDMTMRMFCSPAKIVLRLDGPPGTEMDEEFPNPMGACDAGSGDPDELLAGMTPEEQQQMQGLLSQGAVPVDLTFKTVAKEGSENVAVYETTMDMGQEGMDMGMKYETRATLEDGRIDHMTITGTMDMGGADMEGMTMAMTIDGDMDFQYGTRAPVPSEYT